MQSTTIEATATPYVGSEIIIDGETRTIASVRLVEGSYANDGEFETQKYQIELEPSTSDKRWEIRGVAFTARYFSRVSPLRTRTSKRMWRKERISQHNAIETNMPTARLVEAISG